MAPSAGAASPLADCAQGVIRDWAADGSVDDAVPLACYRAALRALPEDALQYSDAGQSIQDAMAFARGRRPEAPGANGTGARPPGSVVGDDRAAANTEHRGSHRSTASPLRVAPGVVAASSTSFPSPIVPMGTSALVLLGTAAAGVVVARRR